VGLGGERDETGHRRVRRARRADEVPAGVQAGATSAVSPVPGIPKDREEAGKTIPEREGRGEQPQDGAVLRAAT